MVNGKATCRQSQESAEQENQDSESKLNIWDLGWLITKLTSRVNAYDLSNLLRVLPITLQLKEVYTKPCTVIP